MILLTIKQIDDFFTELFEKLAQNFTLSTFFVLLAGILIGFVLCSSIYGVLMLISLRKKREIRIDKEFKIDADEELLQKNLETIKLRFIDSTETLSIKERFEALGPTLMETVNVVAGTYYPNSKYPLYELSITELILFLKYISERVEEIFEKPFLKPFKNITISQIFKIIDVQKKINENKIVRAVNNNTTNKVTKIILGAINYANPVYWIKKLVMGSTINLAIKKICLVVIDIVGDETNKTYSKTIFNEERKLYIKDIDDTLDDMKGES